VRKATLQKQLWMFDYGTLLANRLDSIANFVYAEDTFSIGTGKLCKASQHTQLRCLCLQQWDRRLSWPLMNTLHYLRLLCKSITIMLTH